MDESSGGKQLPEELIKKITEQSKDRGEEDRELVEVKLSPTELTSVIIDTLKSEIYPSVVALYKNFGEKIKDIPQMADFAKEMAEAAIDTNADIELMTEVADLALKGQSIKLVERKDIHDGIEEDRSFLYLGPRTNHPDVDPATIKTVENISPEQLNGALLRTVENRTKQSMSIVQMYPEIALMSMPGHAKAGDISGFVNQAKKITDSTNNLEKTGYKAINGEAVKVTKNSKGNRVLALARVA